MTPIKIAQLALALCLCTAAKSQNYIDQYFTDPLSYDTVLTSVNNISQPRDLDFKPGTDELWVMNRGVASGSSWVIAYHAGTPQQSIQYRKDSHSSHFTVYGTAMAFGNVGEFAALSEIRNTNSSSTSTFMGPSLWSADTAITARVFQNNWVSGYPLGSHLDMLHQSPFGMGVAHDTANRYWVTDGHFGNIVLYDYGVDHGPGYDNHSDGRIWRYTDIPFVRVVNIPGHIVKDTVSGWMYYVNSGPKTLCRFNPAAASVAGILSAPSTSNEPLQGYWDMQGATYEVIDTFATQICGIEVFNDRLLVSDYDNGNIYVYDLSSGTPVFMDTIITGQATMEGIKIGVDGKIWFVNNAASTVCKIDLALAQNDASLEIVSPILYNTAPLFYNTKFDLCAPATSVTVTITNSGATAFDSCLVILAVDDSIYSTTNLVATLNSGDDTTITLPTAILAHGEHHIVAWVEQPNSMTDGNPANNMKSGAIRTIDANEGYPYFYGFDSTSTFPANGWTYIGYNRTHKMTRVTNCSGYSNSTGCMRMNNMANVNIIGQRDYLFSPMIDLSAAPVATSLSFSLAYTGKYASDTDSLIVSVSNDCGATWTAISRMGESPMATAPHGTAAFVPDAAEWETINLSLASYVGSPNVMIMFETYSGWGNHLYIDDIRVEDVTGVDEHTTSTLKVYPNPSAGIFTLENSQAGQVVVTDIAGRIVTTQKVNGGVNSIDLSAEAIGCYFMTMQFSDGTVATERIVIQ